jgi:hypothetical protein
VGYKTTRERDPLGLPTGHFASAVTFQTIEFESFEPRPRNA